MFLSLISINIILPVLELCSNRIIQYIIFNSFYFYMVSMKNTWYEYGIIFLSFILLFKLFSVFGYFFSAVQFSSVQSLSHVRLFLTPWSAVCQSSLSITNSQSLLKLMSIELVMPSNHLIFCRPLLFLPSIIPKSEYLKWVSSSKQVAKVLEF